MDARSEKRAPDGIDPADRAWAAIPILLPALVVLISRMGTIDLAYHVRAGDEILAVNGLPARDTWTFTAGAGDWVDQQWGAQVVLSAVHAIDGWATVLLMWAVLSSLVTWLIYLASRGQGADVRSAALLALAGYFVARPALSMRPQLLALPAFGVALWAIVTRRTHPRRMWLLPAAAALTANLHGSFVMFPLLAGLALLEDRRDGAAARRDGLVLGAVLLATLINPYGLEIWTYAHRLSTNPIIRTMITEWKPITLTSLAGSLVFGSAFAVAVFLARRREAARWIDLLWLGVFLVLALSAQRAIVWWAMVFPVVVAGLVRPRERSTHQRSSSVPAYSLIGVLTIAVVALLPWWRGANGAQFLRDAPSGLTVAVDELPAGTRLLAHQPWGSWLEFSVRDVPLFVDSRIELYPRDVWDAYREVGFSGARWREALEDFGVEAIVADADDWDLIPILRDDPAWRVAYEDEEGVLFVRARGGDYSLDPTVTRPERAAVRIAARRLPTPSFP